MRGGECTGSKNSRVKMSTMTGKGGRGRKGGIAAINRPAVCSTAIFVKRRFVVWLFIHGKVARMVSKCEGFKVCGMPVDKTL